MKTGWAKLLNAHIKSFTLVEMLVVICIIAILAALLLPEIGTVKDRVKAVTCAHNEKRMGEAFGSYLNDNQGFYPYIQPTCAPSTNVFGGTVQAVGGCAYGAYNASANGQHCYASVSWNINLVQYYECSSRADLVYREENNLCNDSGCTICDAQMQKRISTYATFVQCPSNPWLIPLFGGAKAGGGCDVEGGTTVSGRNQPDNNAAAIAGGAGITWRFFPTTYAMNGDFFPQSFGSGLCTDPSGFNKCVNMSDISHPSALALVGEMPWCMYQPASPPNIWNATWLPANPYMTASGIGGTNTTIDVQWTNVTRFAYCNSYAAAWHRKSMNTLFPDGHVEQIPQSMLMSNSVQYQKDSDQTEAGWIFFNDGKAKNWYAGQFPGYNLPQSFQ